MAGRDARAPGEESSYFDLQVDVSKSGRLRSPPPLPRNSGFGDDERLRVQFAAVKGAWALHLLFGGGAVVGGDGGADLEAALLHQLFEPHAGHALGRVVEPLADDDLAVVRGARVGLALLQTLLHQRVCEKSVAQLRGFERGLIAL